jgi:hypothetical protein
VLLCAAAELEPGLAAALARGSGGSDWPSWALALRALAEARWEALAPEAPLRRWQLVRSDAGPDWLQARLRLDERILHHLVGLEALDGSLVGAVRPQLAPAWLPPARREAALALAARLAPAWAAPCVLPAPLPGCACMRWKLPICRCCRPTAARWRWPGAARRCWRGVP